MLYTYSEIKPVTEDAVAAPVDAEIATTPAVAPTEKKDEAEVSTSYQREDVWVLIVLSTSDQAF
jgi:hypothetical protein